MRRRKATKRSTVPVRASHEELAREAAEWDAGLRSPAGFRLAPEAVPRAAASESISLRMPAGLLKVIRAFAARDRVGYQVLIKRWLDDRVRCEREKLAGRLRTAKGPSAPAFPLEDRESDGGPHFRSVH